MLLNIFKWNKILRDVKFNLIYNFWVRLKKMKDYTRFF